MPPELLDAGGGKKGKKGKKVVLPPGVEKCQRYGAGCLRHLAMFSNEARAERARGRLRPGRP